MSNNEKSKFWRISRDFAIVMLVLEVISMIYCYALGILESFTTMNIVLFAITGILYLCIIIGCEKHIELGPISGIILSVLHLISTFYSHNLSSLIFGLILLFIFVKLYLLLYKENKTVNTLEVLTEKDEIKDSVESQNTNNQVDEKLKSNILNCAWGIVAYELVFNIIVPFVAYTFILQNTETNIGTILGIFFMMLFLAVILPALIITFIIGFIFTIITTIDVKKCKKATTGFYICNYVFQFVFWITIGGIAEVNVIAKVLVSIIALVGIYISYIASKYLQEYNKSFNQNKQG